MYWSEDDDLGVECVKRAFSKNRFLELKRYMHFCDNEARPNDEVDKYYKIRPLLKLCQTNFAKFSFLHERFSIDEKMVQYFGRNKLKQYIKGKPIRFGYKIWALCFAETGYCYAFEPYQGRSDKKETSMGFKVIEQLSVSLPPGSELYFDSFFTSLPVLKYLNEKKIQDQHVQKLSYFI